MNEADITAELIEPAVTEIDIRVECSIGEKGDGAWWDIVDIIDERHGWSLGDSGVYEFDAEFGITEKLSQYVLQSLAEAGEFDDEDALFVVSIRFMDGGIELGAGYYRFLGRDTLNWPFRQNSN